MAIDFSRPPENLSTAVTLACFKIEGNLPFFMVSLTKLQIQDEKVQLFPSKLSLKCQYSVHPWCNFLWI